MGYLLPSVLVLHLIIIFLIYTSLVTNSWWSSESRTQGLWTICSIDRTRTCDPIGKTPGDEWLHAAQAAMLVAAIFTALSGLVFLCQLFALRRGSLFYVTAVFQVFASLCVFSAALIYTLHGSRFRAEQSGSLGYSFALSWISFPLCLSSGVLYIHIRKLQ
uniref:Epithelial membrane protein 3 n=1 Tax=Callorhinchus milii TaxID=7868 RepID=V9LHA8_CALMI